METETQTEEDPSPGGECSDREVCRSYLEAASGSVIENAFAGEVSRGLEQIGRELHVSCVSRDNWIRIESADREAVEKAGALIRSLLESAGTAGRRLRSEDLNTALSGCAAGDPGKLRTFFRKKIKVSPKKGFVTPRTVHQLEYVEAAEKSDIVFALGPAGTGKTYLAVAMAVASLLAGTHSRIILARPAVEAGETLGFLPGDIEEKINPYLRPLADALREMLEPAEISSMKENGMIEIAPLAFMRGRTLNRSFIILDEAQNATREQMLMFLTRMGEDSKCIVAGDPTQTDLNIRSRSGLEQAVRLLSGTEGIRICRFGREDVLRHTLVEKIIRAYEADQEGVEK